MNSRLMITTLVAGSALATPLTASASTLWCTTASADGHVEVVVHSPDQARVQLESTLNEMDRLVSILRGVHVPEGVDARVEMLMRDLVDRTKPGGDLACW